MLMKTQFFILLSLFSIIISIKDDPMIVFPFKSIPLSTLGVENINENPKEEYNSLIFLDEHYVFRLLSPLKIGTPPQDIISFVNTYSDILLIGEMLKIPNKIYPQSFYRGYHYNESSSFINITFKNNESISDKKEFIGEENIYLYTNINDIKENKYSKISNFKFKIENQIQYNHNVLYGLIIGLILDDKNSETNFMKQIHNRNLISSYIVSFEYTNETEGMVIIGKYPHEYLPQKYKEGQYKSFYSYQPKTMYLTNFEIEFNEIYSFSNNEKNVLEKNPRGKLFLNSGLIIGTNEYMKYIEENFFNHYINNSICEKNEINNVFYDFIIFSCNDNKDFNTEKFPKLNFNRKTENLTFEFEFKDLFKKINNKYYFLIVFELYGEDIWKIGKPFFLKYTFVYNGDAKTIGFYEIKNENKNKEENNNLKFELSTVTIVIIILFFLVFIILAIIIAYYFGKKCNINRKKHANELDDDNFDYDSPFSSN